jgi:hypothetical protein
MPSVTVIIVNYNAGAVLSELVNPLLCSLAVAKVIVADNGSTDKSMDDIERIAGRQSRLITIYNKANLGFAKACNIAVNADGQSDYVLFINPDCIIKEYALERLLAFMKSSPQTGMAGPLILNPDGTEQAGGRRAIPTPWRSFVQVFGLVRFRDRYPRLFSDFLFHEQSIPDKPIEVEAISGACMMVRRSALLDVGHMDDGYFLHCEDLDLCMSLRAKGWKINFVPAASVVHHQGTCSKDRPIFVEWHKHKGMMRFYGKYFHHQYPGILFWIVGIGVWLRFCALAIKHSARHMINWFKHDRT